MTWRIEISDRAVKALKKTDKIAAKRIYREIKGIRELENPRSKGKALVGNLAGLWRYRVGDYRILCDILDDAVVVLVIDVAHRKDAYKR